MLISFYSLETVDIQRCYKRNKLIPGIFLTILPFLGILSIIFQQIHFAAFIRYKNPRESKVENFLLLDKKNCHCKSLDINVQNGRIIYCNSRYVKFLVDTDLWHYTSILIHIHIWIKYRLSISQELNNHVKEIIVIMKLCHQIGHWNIPHSPLINYGGFNNQFSHEFLFL